MGLTVTCFREMASPNPGKTLVAVKVADGQKQIDVVLEVPSRLAPHDPFFASNVRNTLHELAYMLTKWAAAHEDVRLATPEISQEAADHDACWHEAAVKEPV